jgi:uncharacterized membrane protein YfbV (UPF0208 family)
MAIDFKIGDCVMLKSDNINTMTIENIIPELNEATCVWYNDMIKDYEKRDFSLSILKHCPKELSDEEMLKRVQQVIVPRKHL